MVYNEKENTTKTTLSRRKKLAIKLGRDVSVEEIEEIIEKSLNEVSS